MHTTREIGGDSRVFTLRYRHCSVLLLGAVHNGGIGNDQVARGEAGGAIVKLPHHVAPIRSVRCEATR